MENDSLNGPPRKSRTGLVLLLTGILLIGVYVAWNLYRPQVIITRCDDVAGKSVESINRRYLEGDQNRKKYDEIFEECLTDFGYYE